MDDVRKNGRGRAQNGSQSRRQGPGRLKENARTVALAALVRWAEKRLPIDRVFQHFVQTAGLDAQERRLARNIVYGVLREREVLDAAISAYANTPLARMDRPVRVALRVGAYQLLRLSRVPDSAAVNTTVNALKMGRPAPWLVGFVNGILRRMAAGRGTLARFAKDNEGRPRTNHPAWLCERWQKQFGEDTMRRICALNNEEPELALRVNTRKVGRTDFLEDLRRHGLRARAGRLSPLAVVVEDYPGPIHTLAGYEAGLFQVQDEGAQLLTMLLTGRPDAAKPMRILDACAGLGGKTSQLAELLPGSTLIALEPDSFRFRLLQENLQRLGHGRQVECVRNDLAKFAVAGPQKTEPFDAILVDAPCSGTGVIRRQPDIRWNRQPADIPKRAGVQFVLLHEAASLLKPGGLLVYATCSLEPEENAQVVSRFLASHSAFSLEPATPRLPESARHLVREGGYLATTPVDGCDGFFGACLRRAV